MSDSNVGPSSAQKYRFYRGKTEKWGRMLLYAGYVIMGFNLFALVMTTLNMLGFFKDTMFDGETAV